MAKKQISIIHGPNLNLLGQREPEVYGKTSLAEINELIQGEANKLNVTLDIFQSNSEAEIVNHIHQLKADFMIINPAAFTHTSVAIRDAVAGIKMPFIEVHISNVFARETFRKESFFSDIAVAVISGLGAEGYLAALRFAAK
ncbi:MAG: type II 3-dehydroquinate dehydratase [Proteobacteria bacterium]|jgi:3-dehydroquinate dehydratase II|nr:type II 3-dehydroquinate dehydratase [Pseudomonadota bacterium]MDA0872382.1 type II 3-dehydroquinate dehydratase [Pseudomonadota bacterium]